MTVIREDGPDGATYPRRARQLVRNGRAEWVDETTIRLLPDPPGERAEEMETTGREEWVGYLRQLVEKVIADDELAQRAIDGITAACAHGVSPSDEPSTAISRIMESNRQLKIEALKVLHELITVHA